LEFAEQTPSGRRWRPALETAASVPLPFGRNGTDTVSEVIPCGFYRKVEEVEEV
jgi:hypothetical protein